MPFLRHPALLAKKPAQLFGGRQADRPARSGQAQAIRCLDRFRELADDPGLAPPVQVLDERDLRRPVPVVARSHQHRITGSDVRPIEAGAILELRTWIFHECNDVGHEDTRSIPIDLMDAGGALISVLLTLEKSADARAAALVEFESLQGKLAKVRDRSPLRSSRPSRSSTALKKSLLA